MENIKRFTSDTLYANDAHLLKSTYEFTSIIDREGYHNSKPLPIVKNNGSCESKGASLGICHIHALMELLPYINATTASNITANKLKSSDQDTQFLNAFKLTEFVLHEIENVLDSELPLYFCRVHFNKLPFEIIENDIAFLLNYLHWLDYIVVSESTDSIYISWV